MKLNFKTSVIIPVYNAEKFVRKALESAINLSEVGEVLLIEDGSSDNSLFICKQLENEFVNVKLLNHAGNINKGAAASRNVGIQNASFDYIAFLDADDYYLANRFKVDREILESDPLVDGVYNALGSELLDEFAKENKKIILTTIIEKIAPEELFYKMGPIGNAGWFSGDALTVRKTVFEKVGLYDETLQIGEDANLWMRMALKVRLVGGELKEPVAIRGIHESNTINDSEKFQRLLPLMFKATLDWCILENVSSDKKYILWNKYSFYNKGNLFLFSSILKYSFLLKYKQFWLRLPFLKFILK